MTRLTVSFLPLTDAAPFLVAHAKGVFQKHGLEVSLRREPSWTALRDSMNKGTSHAAQMLFGMPAAAACGLLGDKQKPLVVPWVLSRNGQAITLDNRYRGQIAGYSSALCSVARERRDAGRPLVFGHTLRYTAVTSQEIWPDHPEKVCVFTEEFAEQKPDTVVAMLKALHQSGLWLDDEANHDEAAALLAQPEHLNCDAAWIRSRLGPKVVYGDGRARSLDHSLVFSKGATNRPSPSYAVWFLTQLRRWGLHYGVPDYAGVASRVIRPDFYERAVRELGLTDTAPDDSSETLFDGKVFNPADPEGYATGFTLKTLLG
jgi:ABC-type nitrate/sulfonate/bicarbonate transport system substrate-binding protein